MRDYDELGTLPTIPLQPISPNPSLRPPLRAAGARLHGGYMAPGFQNNFPASPKSLPFSLPRRRGGAPLLRVMSAPPRPRRSTVAKWRPGSAWGWDRPGGRPSARTAGSWRGEGPQGWGNTGQVRRRQDPPSPVAPQATCETHFPGTLHQGPRRRQPHSHAQELCVH